MSNAERTEHLRIDALTGRTAEREQTRAIRLAALQTAGSIVAGAMSAPPSGQPLTPEQWADVATRMADRFASWVNERSEQS